MLIALGKHYKYSTQKLHIVLLKRLTHTNSQDSLSGLTFKLKLLVLEYGVLSKIVLSDWTLFVDYKGQFNEFSMIKIKVFHRMCDVFITDLELVSWNV